MAQPQLHTALNATGIAGIVLTMGMAVDANVLIYERIREESLRQGRKMVDAISKGFERAFASIFDSNLTTFLTAMFLFIFGTGPIRGFAITLMIGIATSFFTGGLHLACNYWVDGAQRRWVKNFFSALSWRQLCQTTGTLTSWASARRLTCSVSFILIGFILIAIQGLNYGVDFKGGRSYTLSFKNSIEATAMRNALSESFEGTGLEVKNFNSSNMVKSNHILPSWWWIRRSWWQGARCPDCWRYKIYWFWICRKRCQCWRQTFHHWFIEQSGRNHCRWYQELIVVGRSIASILGIFIYILLRFKKWEYSTGAIVALIHDSLFIFASFAIIRCSASPSEIDQVFVAALLTVIGYSINDTVIIFDRIREYMSFGSLKGNWDNIHAAINHVKPHGYHIGRYTVGGYCVVDFGGEVLRALPLPC